MIPVPTGAAARLRRLFGAEHRTLVVDAILAGNTPARLWADDLERPRAALLWDGVHGVVLAGEPEPLGAWRALVDRVVVAARPGYLKVDATGPAAEVFDGLPLRRLNRVFLRYADTAPPAVTRSLPAEFRVGPIDAGELEGRGRLGHAADLVEEIESGWGSVSAFGARGFGIRARDDTAIVGWCTCEYLGAGRCGVGIETVEAYRRRGLATATASAFVTAALARGLVPCWDSWAENAPSIAVARRVGFEPVEAYSVLVGSLD